MDRTLINLNQSKGFDKVYHQYLEVVLVAAGYGPVFRSWIETIYSDICSVVKVKDHLSESFNFVCSDHQGRPVLSVQYVLALVPLLGSWMFRVISKISTNEI